MLIPFFCLLAQKPPIKFEHISQREGISQTSVYSIVQDQKGFVWFGTQNGLNRYDGQSVKVYQTNDEDSTSLSDNFIHAIFEDAEGTLWVGTSEGLNQFDRSTDSFIRYTVNKNSKDGLSNYTIRNFTEDQDGNIWIATFNGINKFDKKNKAFTQYPFDRNNKDGIAARKAQSILCDRNNNIWIGFFQHGVQRFDPKTETFKTVFEEETEKPSLGKITVRDLYEDSHGYIWCGTIGYGLRRINPNDLSIQSWWQDENDFNSLASNSIYDITEDPEGNLFFCTDNGLDFIHINDLKKPSFIFNHLKNEPFDPFSLNSNYIRSILIDRQGILWIGTTDSGVNKWDKNLQHFGHHYPLKGFVNSLSNGVVWSLLEDDEKNIWVGTANGLNRIDGQTGKVSHFFNDPFNPQSISHDRAWCLLQEADTLWVGTSEGLNKMTQKNGKFIFKSYQYQSNLENSISSNSVRCLLIDSKNNFWVGTNNGLNLFNRQTKTFKRFFHSSSDPQSLSNTYIRCIHEDHKGQIWIGTAAGLNKMIDPNGKFISYHYNAKDSTSLSDYMIRSIGEDRFGNLWIGTHKGLNKMIVDIDETTNEEKISFQQFTVKSGMPDNVVYGILDDEEGNIWFSTNEGISKLDHKTEQFKNFDYRDGLQSKEFNNGAIFKGKSGKLYFGGINGFNVFDAKQVSNNSYKAPIQFTDFKIYNKSVKPIKNERLDQAIGEVKQINLLPNDKMFSFYFAALNFSQPESNQYAYRLVNFDDQWNYSGNEGYAYFTNIPPGNYTFEVKAAGSDGVWNEKVSSIDVYIKSPWWKTWWAYLLYGLTFLCLLIARNRYQKKQWAMQTQLKVQEQKLETFRKDQETQNLRSMLLGQENERKRIASDLHDGLGALLATVKAHFTTLGNHFNTQPENKATYQKTNTLIDDACKEVRKIAHNMMPGALTRFGLTAIKDIGENLEILHGIQTDVELIGLHGRLEESKELMIYRIIQECTNNIVKHAQAKNVLIQVMKQSKDLTIIIEDDGIGFDLEKAKAKKGIGLKNIESRVQFLGGELSIDTIPNEGTTFIIQATV